MVVTWTAQDILEAKQSQELGIPVTTMEAISRAGAAPFLTNAGVQLYDINTGNWLNPGGQSGEVKSQIMPAQLPVVQQSAIGQFLNPGANVPGLEEAGGLGALISLLGSAAGQVLPGLLAKAGPILAGTGAGYLINELIGGGGGSGQAVVGGVPLGGPGLAEPPASMVAKEWAVNGAQFYKLIDGRIMVYSKKKGTWKIFRPAKHIVVSRNPKIGTLLRAAKRVDNYVMRANKRFGKFHRRMRMKSRRRY